MRRKRQAKGLRRQKKPGRPVRRKRSERERGGLAARVKKNLSAAGKSAAEVLPEDGARAQIVSLSRGFAFARTEESGEDVFIPHDALSGAFLGDTVELCDVRSRPRGPAGAVRRVLSRAPTELTGTLAEEDGGLSFYADGAVHYAMRVARKDRNGAGDGDKVLARVRADGFGEWTEAAVLKRFGPGSSARVCADAVLVRYGIPTEFSEEALREAERVAVPFGPEELEGRLDLRNEKIFTVDGADAKDLDDAVSVRRTRNGYVLGVHIADASHYVHEDTALDREAESRGTSVYFADRVVPMLPETLSNGVCSLNAGEDKLTLSALMHFDRDGEMTRYEFRKSVIRSRVRGVYSEVNALFDGTADRRVRGKYRPVHTQLFAARELAALLKKRAMERGRMDLDSAELRFVLDENGVCTALLPRRTGEAEEMIEQLMVAANTAAARFALRDGMPFLYRIHEEPEGERVSALVQLLEILNVKCGPLKHDRPAVADFAAVLEGARGTAEEAVVSQRILRTMEKARYAPVEKGHYGLALAEYAHFTSPIRRYPDTAVHRMISRRLSGMSAAAMHGRYDDFVQRAARTASAAEVRAMSAERDAEDCYVAEYLAQHVGESFPGVVSGVVQRGVFVRIPNGAEGFVSLDRFPGERFVFDGEITQRSEKRTLTVGTRLTVTVLSANVAAGRAEFAPGPGEERP